MIIGRLTALLGADNTGLKRGMAEGSAAVRLHTRKMRGSIDSTTKSMGLMNKMFMASIAIFAGQRAAGSFIDVAKSFETMEVKLDTLTRGRGTEVLEEINEWAIRMPVNTKQAVDAFVTMQAMGLDPTIDKMQILADVSSIFGDEVLGRVSLALGQMSTLGRVSAQDLNQLAQSGINARKYLKDAFGMTVEEFQKSGKAISDATDAIWAGMEKEFGGSALKMMDSWQGLVVTFQSGIMEIQRAVMGAGVFDELKTQIKGANVALFDWLENNRELIKLKVPEYIGKVKSAVSTIWDIVNYDPAIATFGLIGLVLFGKKGAVVIGGLAHLANVVKLQAKAFRMMADDQLKFGDVATANFKELEALVAGAEKKFGLITPLEKARKKVQEIEAAIVKMGNAGFDPNSAMITKLNRSLNAAKNQMYALVDVGDETGKRLARGIYGPLSENRSKEIFAALKKELGGVDAAYEKLLKDQKRLSEEAAKARAVMGSQRMALDLAPYFEEVDQYEDALNKLAKIKPPKMMDQWEYWKAEEYLAKSAKAKEKLLEQEESFSKSMLEMSERTAWAMQENFSNFFFDAMQGQFKTLGDYVNSFLDTLQKAFADYLGQMATQLLLGDLGKMVGGGGWLGSIGNWVGSLFSGGGLAPAHVGAGGTTAFKMAGGGHLGEGVKGVGIQSGKSYEFHRNESVIPDGSLGGGNVQVIINNNTGAEVNQRQEQGGDGIQRLVIDIGANDIMSGGEMASAMEIAYNLKRVGRG